MQVTGLEERTVEYIAKLVMDAMGERERQSGFGVKVGVSARHVHRSMWKHCLGRVISSQRKRI